MNVTDNSAAATNSVDVFVGDIPVNDNVTVTVDATVNAATVGQPIPNTAYAVWTSLPNDGTPNGSPGNDTGSTTPGASGAVNGERNGTTAPLSTNTYASNGSATLDIINPAPVKSLVTTSEASTTGNNVAIGEIVRYQLVVQIPHATSPSYQIIDQLPTGLSFLNDGTIKVAFVSASGTTLTSSDSTINSLPGLNFAGSSSNVTPTATFPSSDISGGTGSGGAFVDGNQPVFSFSNVTNSDTNNSDPDYIVLDFNVLVDNVAGNTTGHVDVNTFIDKVSGAQVGPASNAIDVTIVQPSITNVAKTVQSTGRDPGDTVDYRVTYSNTGGNDAFQARTIDSLPASLSFNVGSESVTLGGGATGVTDNSSGNTLDITIGDVPVGGTVQINYTANILTTDTAGESITNTANVTYASLPGPFGTTVNATGSSTPGSAGSGTGERNGTGGVNSYFDGSSQIITINSSTLTGFVYQDLNNNGVKDAGEPGISGATVTLTGTNFLGTAVSSTAITNASGQYSFTNLLPSDVNGYTVTVTQPAAYLQGKETPPSNSNFSGTVGAGSNFGSDSTNNLYSGIVVGHESDLTGSNYNFGELPPATVSGSVYIDANDDGVRQGSETGISGVQVELQGTDDLGDTITQFTSTNGTGNFSFAGLRPGSYSVSEPTPPAGYLNGLDNQGNNAAGVIAGSATGPRQIPGSGTITLGVGATSANNMFGELQPASLAGFVYVDANNDGVKQAGEAGIANVTVTLTGTDDLGDSINQAVATLSSGAYSFTNLRPGTYIIAESQPTSYEEGKDTIGTPGGNAAVQDVFSNIVLNESVNGTNNNFGERLTADLAINKTDYQTTAIPGTPIAYTITITNNGPSTVNTLTMTDVVPAAILNPVFSGASSGTFSSATGLWTGLTLTSGQNITIQMTGTVDPAATGTLSNTATVSNAQDGSGNPILDPISANNSSTDIDTLTPQATLTISKTDGTATYTAGTSTTYTIVVTNTGPSDVTGAAVTDTLPSAITSDTWTAAYAASSNGPANGTGNISTDVNLATAGTATFTVVSNIASTATGNLVNTATVTNPINDILSSATDTDTPNPISDLAITKTDGLTTVIPGNALTYTIVVTNNGPTFAAGATVVDNMPAAFLGAAWTVVYAGAGSSGPASGTGNINTPISVAVGGTATFTVTGTVVSTATGTLSNTATVAPPTGTTDSNPNNNSATQSNPLTPQGDLSITKTDGTATYTAGTADTYTIVASNSGPSFVTAATVADNIPASFTGATWTAVYTGVGSTGPASGSGSINAAVNLASGGNVTFTLTGSILSTTTGNLVNTATVAAPSGFTDTNPNNNSATDTDTPNPISDLAITKTDGQTTVIPGDAITYTIVATNNGPTFAAGAMVVDTMPATFLGAAWTVVYAGTGSSGPANGTGNINTPLNLAVGGTATFTVTGTVASTATGTLSNTATVAPPTGTTDSNPNNNSATVNNPLTPQGDLSITKTDGSATYTAGTADIYTIVVSNSGPSFVTGATVTDNLPANLTGATWTAVYTGTGSSGAASGSGSIGTAINLAAGGTATFTLSATSLSTATGNLVNTATVAAPPTFTDTNPNNNSATDTDTPFPISDLAITKTDGQTTVIPGNALTYTIVVTNNGPTFAAGATVVDNMPAAFLGAAWTVVYAGAGSSGPASGSGNINTPVSVAVGGTATFTVTGTVVSTATGTLTNTATVAPPTGTTDSNPNNNSATQSNPMTPQGDLSITKTDGSATYTAGTADTYTIVASNSGPSFVTAATVADNVPASFTGVTWTAVYTGVGSTGPASGSGSINAAVNLASGGNVTFMLTGNILSTTTGNLVNTATVTAPTGFTDTNPNNNSATDTDTPNPISDLAITKTDGQTTVIPGNALTYTIVVTNNGPTFAAGATVVDNMPAAFLGAAWTVVYAGIGSSGPANGSSNINTPLNLAVGGTATFTVTGTVASTATGTLSNTATVAPPTGTTDSNPNNNSTTATNPLTPQGDLSITKTDGSATYTAGTADTYTIVVSNSGPSFVTGATVTDNLPANLTGATWTAVYSGTGSGGAASGSGSIGTAINLAVGGTATFTLSATSLSTATGNLVNTATVAAPPTFTDTNPNNNSATDTDTPFPISDLAITKTDGQTTVIPGTAITYTIVVTNNGPSFAAGATVVDNVPAIFLGAAWTVVYAGIGSSGPASGTGNINTPVSVAVGGTATFTVTGTVISTATGTLSNTATVAPPTGTTDSNPNNNSATDNNPLTPQGDLSITKTDGSATYTAGTAITYTIVARNSGPSFVTAATVADLVPANITGVTWTAVYVGTGSTGPASSSGNLNAAVNLAAAGSVTFTLTGTILSSAAGNLVNTATVAAPIGFTDTNPNNNSATDTDTPNPIADLAVTKTGPATAIANDTVTYSITVKNNGPSDAQAVSLTDPMPADVSFVSQMQISGPIFALSAPTGNVDDTIATLSAGASAAFQVVVHVDNPSPPGIVVTNIATVASTTPDSNLANNTSQVQTTIGGTTVSGFVYIDSNTNKARDAGEPGIGGVIISLVDSTGNLIATTTTAIDGSYTFHDLATGAYTILETAPAGYGSSTPHLLAINLPAGGLVNENFGATTGSVSGTVYFDGNNDGIQETGEPGIPNVTVTLTGTDIDGNPVNRAVSTAVNGTYGFAGLLAPSAAGYTLTETQPANFTAGKDAAGAAGGVTTVQDVISAINLVGGENAPGYNFAQRGTVVAGTVYIDLNKNGTLDPGEPGEGDVPVTLLNSSGNTVASTLSNPDGSYLFSGIVAGNYRIVESPPGGFTADTSTSLNVAVPPGGLLNQNFGLTTPNGSLAGLVFVDLNNNGTQQAGEPGIPGVTVTLTSGANVIATTTTAADGSFIFTNLPAAAYTVTETQPLGYNEGQDRAGTSGGNASVQDVISAVTLGSGVNATGYTFGELGPMMGGNVFNDTNTDGVFETGEPGHSGVTVTLRNSQGNVVGTTTSAANGTYGFGPLTTGLYTVTETPPAGFTTTSPTVINITLPPGGLGNQNFGLTAGSRLAGSVYFDSNNDGIRQASEPGIGGVTVKLTGTNNLNNPVSVTITTAADGTFVFENLVPSNAAGYTVTETQPAGYGEGKDLAGTAGGSIAVQDVISGVFLGANVNATGYLFGEISGPADGTITGTVFMDNSGTGNPSGQPPIGGVTVALENNVGATIASTTTAADGTYDFANVVPGSDTVVETQPTGYGNSPATPATTIPVTVTAGALLTGNNFGETLSSLSGNIFADNNNDGILDGADFGIAGVTVTLKGPAGNVLQTTTSDKNGNYSFLGLAAGNYTVIETQPALYVTGKDIVGTLGENVTPHVTNQFSVGVGAGVNGTGYNFAEIPTADPQGYVWEDINDNGIREPAAPNNEPGIYGVTITMTGTDILGDTVNVSTVTDETGLYQFTFRNQAGTLPLLPGTYSITEIPPAAYLFGQLQNGTPAALDLQHHQPSFFGHQPDRQAFLRRRLQLRPTAAVEHIRLRLCRSE